MNRFTTTILALIFTGAAQATVIWDQGPTTGTFGGSFANQTASQNFADRVLFTSNTLVDGLNYFSEFNLTAKNGASDFHLKILGDNGGIPDAVLFADDIGYSNFTLNFANLGGNDSHRYEFAFTSQLFLANTSYWVGLSGNDFEAAQASVNTPQDGQMAQFNGVTFQFMTRVGDQMFQLTSSDGTPVPEPSSLALIGLALGIIGAARLKREVRS